MKTWKAVGLALPAFAVGACAVLPAHDAEVDDARAAVLAAQNDPQVVSLAPVELNKAVDAMRRTDAAWSNGDDIEAVHHLAYLAWAQAAIEREDRHFTLFGGEPLLMPKADLEALWAWGYQRFGTNSVQTNGTLIDRPTAFEVAPNAVTSTVSRVSSTVTFEAWSERSTPLTNT